MTRALILLCAAVLGCGSGANPGAAPPDPLPASAGPGPDEPPPPLAEARPTEPVTFEEGCLTAGCHAPLGGDPHHARVTAERCATCHLGDVGGHVYPVHEELDEACLACHEVAGDVALDHGLADGAACLACHAPHVGPGPGLLAAPTTAATCGACHAEHAGRYRHTPFIQGACVSCHDPHAVRAGEAPLTKAEGCASCHEGVAERLAGAPHSHAGLERGCLTCHDPHASPHRGHLRAPVGDLCLGCHEDVRATIEGADVAHEAVLSGERCVACHDPHGSNHRALLVRDHAGLCLECHGDEVETPDGRMIPDMTAEVLGQDRLHGPVLAGDCAACHGIHGSEEEHLLLAPPGTDPADLEHGLCFACHDPVLLAELDAGGVTDFRDGGRNLHAVHAAGDTHGRGCTLCHRVHGGEGAHGVARDVAFESSDWRLEIGFAPTPDGGTCATSCHEALPYVRTEVER